MAFGSQGSALPVSGGLKEWAAAARECKVAVEEWGGGKRGGTGNDVFKYFSRLQDGLAPT